MWNCVHQILDILWNHLVPDAIKLPTVEDARYEAQIFCREAGFPAPIIYGAIGKFLLLIKFNTLTNVSEKLK